jgi:hypothetical protein
VTICFDIKKGSLVIDLNHAILLYGTLLGIKKASLSLSLSLSLTLHTLHLGTCFQSHSNKTIARSTQPTICAFFGHFLKHGKRGYFWNYYYFVF